MESQEIKQRRRCRCCNMTYDYAVPASQATRYFCGECYTIPESIRKVLVRLNRRLTELEAHIKAPQTDSQSTNAATRTAQKTQDTAQELPAPPSPNQD